MDDVVSEFYNNYNYKLCETFKSIQGEGTNTGRVSTFIRLSGCNLKCSFCDEPKHKNKTYEQIVKAKDIVSIVKNNETEFAIITGGEPTMQDCNPLISLLHECGVKVAIETNGYKLKNVHRADLITWSPKTLNYNSFIDSIDGLVSSSNLPNIELKIPFLYKDEDLLAFVDSVSDILGEHIIAKFITPINDTKNLNFEANKKAFNFCMKYPEFSLNMQMHKVLGVE